MICDRIFLFCICINSMVYILQGIKNLQYQLIVNVDDVVEGDFTLHYEKYNKFKVTNISNSEAIVTVPEVRIHTGINL